MPRDDYKTCRGCGKNAGEVGTLSHTSLCLKCSLDALKENILGLSNHEGDALLRWRRGMAASVGGVLLDELPPAP